MRSYYIIYTAKRLIPGEKLKKVISFPFLANMHSSQGQKKVEEVSDFHLYYFIMMGM